MMTTRGDDEAPLLLEQKQKEQEEEEEIEIDEPEQSQNQLQQQQQPVVDLESTLSTWEAVCNIWANSRWFLISTALMPLVHMLNVAVVGRIGGGKMLVGLSLGFTATQFFMIKVCKCFNSGAQTFISHAHGQQESRQCVVYLNKAMLLNIVLLAIISLPMFFIEQIFLAIGQDEEVAKHASDYVHVVLPFCFFSVLATLSSIFASAQEVTGLGTSGVVFGAFMNLVFLYITHVMLDLGLLAVSLSTGLTYLSRFIYNSVLVQTSPYLPKHPDVHFFSLETCTNLMPLFKKCVASTFHGMWNSWALDAIVLISTYLGTEGASTFTIMTGIAGLTHSNSLSFTMGAQIMAGKSIGQRKTNQALQYNNLGSIISTVVALLQIALLWIFRDAILDIYHAKDEAKAIASQTWVIFTLYILLNSTRLMSASFIRAAGKQFSGQFLTLTSSFGSLAFIAVTSLVTDLEVADLWLGQLLSRVALTITQHVLVSCINWEDLYKELDERRAREKAACEKTKTK